MKNRLFIIFIFCIAYNKTNAQTLQLAASDYNGFNISCNGEEDGSIDLTVTGGTPPYTFTWSTGETTEDITDLPAGYYHVFVDDADTTTGYVEGEITLTEPSRIVLELTPFEYVISGKRFNISLNGACNVSITTSVSGGVEPYNFIWTPNGQTTGNLTNLCAGPYGVRVFDATGCGTKALQLMTEPPKNSWTMEGNTDSDPDDQFIGNTDSVDFVFQNK